MKEPGGIYGHNPWPFAGGAYASTVNRLRADARAQSAARAGLLTNAALAAAARGLPGFGVDSAQVRAGFHPALPQRRVPGCRTVVVTPQRTPETDALQPVAPRYLRAIAKQLAAGRILGERLFVVGSRRVPVAVRAELWLRDGWSATAVMEAANTRLRTRLSDVQVDPDLEPWPLGRMLRVEDVEGWLSTLDGVLAVRDCQLRGPTGSFQRAPVVLSDDQLAIGRGHELRTRSVATGEE